MAPRRTTEIERDVARVVAGARTRDAGAPALYYPGGDGGGGRRTSRSQAGAVVLPHPRTSHGCRLCTKYHTTEEHRRHASLTRPSPKKTKTKSSGRTKPKAKPKTKAKTSASRPITPPRDPVQIIQDAVRNMPPAGRFGYDKVFISEIWDRVGRRLGLSLEEFKRLLITLNRGQIIHLARADLVGDMDEDQVRRSEIRDLGSSFHFVVDRAARPPWE